MLELKKIKRKRLSRPVNQIVEQAHTLTAFTPANPVELAENPLLYRAWEKTIDASDLDQDFIFSIDDIRKFCIRYRLIFSGYPAEEGKVPYAALLALQSFNKTEKKKIDTIYLCTIPCSNPESVTPYLAFLKITPAQFYLLYQSKNKFPISRKLKYFPIRNFETIFICVALLAAILSVTLPTRWIWLPEGAPYWGTYRIAAFFHILIFLMGFTTYSVFAFSGHLSAQLWNKFLKN